MKKSREAAARHVKFSDHFAVGALEATEMINFLMITFGVVAHLVSVRPIDLPVSGSVVACIFAINRGFVRVGEIEEFFPILRSEMFLVVGRPFAGRRFVSGKDAAMQKVI